MARTMRMVGGRDSKPLMEGMMIKFRHDDSGYIDWLASHHRGYVVNCANNPKPDYLKLHRATCRFVSGENKWGKTWTNGGYQKVVSDDVAELDRFAAIDVGGALTACPFCKPLGERRPG